MWTDFDEAAVSSLFFLGHHPGQEDYPVVYPGDRDERPHLAYYGTTRSGKTYAIEYALQQLALGPRTAGFCYIDPHGTSYWRMASFLRQYSITDRVLFWDINDPDYIVTYDPFAGEAQAASYIAGNLASALLATLGRQADAHEQPHLKTMTEDGLEALLTLRLPFALARDLFDPNETRLKEAIAGHLTRPNLVTSVAAMPRFQDRREELAAPFRRFVNLFRDDRLRLSFTAAGVDFRRLMDEGWIVLVNTEQRDQSDEAATLFTRLLVKQFFMAAKPRSDDPDPRPFFLAIDEAARYLTTDTAQILDQTAKFGLYLLLGMQGQDQARLENEETYLAIRRNMNGEIVLRLRDYDEAMHFARRFFADGFDYRTIKWQGPPRIAAIPRTVAHVTSSSAVAESEDCSESESSSVTTPYSSDGVGSSIAGSTSSYRSGRTVTETQSEGFHTEYEYREEPPTPVYFTPDELEREASKLFIARPPDMARRFGVARINEQAPAPIEIPQLPSPLYSRVEMADWLGGVKRSQHATLSRHEAEARFASLLMKPLEELENAARKAPTQCALPPPDAQWDFSLSPEEPTRPCRTPCIDAEVETESLLETESLRRSPRAERAANRKHVPRRTRQPQKDNQPR